MIKKVLSFILVFSMFFTNLTFVNAFNMPDEKTDVPDGTFESKLEAKELSNFVSKSNGEVTSNEDGVMLSKKNNDDHHALLNEENKYNSFIYEGDVKLIDGISAGLVIGVADQENVTNSWYAISFNTEDTQNRARLFKVEKDVTNYAYITSDEASSIDFSDTVHMYIEFDEIGNYVFKLSNNVTNEVIKTGKVDNWSGGYIGLLTFDSSALFSNIKITDTSNSDNLKTNLDGIKENDNYRISDIGITGNSNGVNDVFLLSETDGDNFVYEADVKFNERCGAASLVFRASEDLNNKSMYVANINGASGEVRLFKFGQDDNYDLAKSQFIALDENNEYHLKITVIDKHIVYYINGQLVINTADYTMNDRNEDSHYGQNDALTSGKFGLLTWNGNVTYQNIEYTPIDDTNSPQLDDLSVESINGKVDKQIAFSKGQYVYITYVTNSTTAVSLIPEIKNDSEIVATNENGEIVDINNLPVTKDLQTYTLTVRNGNAKVLYRIRVHRMQVDESYYNEDYRGQYHYSVKNGWGNDPCGLVYYKGKYHLFYQYYDSPNWGPMHWAHATSTDLIHWEEQPIQFYPDEYGTMFSGCAVIADHETAPAIFNEGEEGLVFFITSNGGNGSDVQKITAAYSKDGETFYKYDEGKVLINWTDDSLKNTAFRDPKVFRYENKWFMVIAGGPLRIYSSDDLVNWQVESVYGDLHTECPDLYPLVVKDENNQETGEVKWVLDRGGRKYKIGDFKQVNGKWSFVPDEQYASTNADGMGNEDNDGIMNFGPDSYAAMTYYRGDFGTAENFKAQDIIAINWMNTWDSGFNNAIPNANGNTIFNGTYNLQLRLGIKKDSYGKYYLTQTPIDEYKILRDEANKVELNGVTINETNNPLNNFSGDSYEIVANLKPDSTCSEVGFKVRTGYDQETVIKYNLENKQLTIDRLKSGVIVVEGERLNVCSQNVELNADGSIDLHIYVDRSSVEVFTNDYTVAGAMQIFASPVSKGLSVYSIDGNATGNITIYPMKTIWTDKLTPTKPLSVGIDKTNINGYVGDEFTLNSWVSPAELSQDLIYTVDNNDVISLEQNGSQATLKALKAGEATITVAAKQNPNITKKCSVHIYENNFKTNLSDFEAVGGNWYVDDETYIASHNDNGFMFANKISTNKFKYEIDATYQTGILNFIFQSQTKNVWDGCYSLQLNGNTVRLFDFKDDYTFTSTNNLAIAPDNKYHMEINVDDNKIVALVNGVEYINHVISESDRQYDEGYVGLGIFNTNAKYQNFYVTTDTPITQITSKIPDLYPSINANLEDIKALLPTMVTVAGDDNLNKKEMAEITWNLDTIDVNVPDTYSVTGTIANGVTTTVKVITRSNKALADLVAKTYDEKDYTSVSYQEYLKVLANAKEVLSNDDSSQKEIDTAYLNLQLAIENLIPINSINKTALKIAIDLANAITDEDLDKVIPAVANEFIAARDEANTVYNDISATQEEVNNAFDRLANAMHMLDFEKGDKAALEAFINKVNDLVADQYTPATWEAFAEKLANAKVVLANENAMQEEVDSAYKELVTAFLNLRLIPNKDLLEDLINKAEGLNVANYTSDSWNIMQEALNNAKNVFANPNVTQEEVDNAKDVLIKAIAQLQTVTTDNTVKTQISKGDTASVKTGDNGLVAMFAGLALLSVAGYAVLKRKEKQ
ncbi:GH32 C-terminal domain-containing protein [Thomasclavelia spiroformis]|uniref:GH32 C-terminal domain-containing protein n=1 Tax=Thomasclavelia spiroformis TaxID=29348 RepID=UPI0026DD7AB7|nr:GH32 C-terminal domain-containing protein [Thomasclavelia spiroformis]